MAFPPPPVAAAMGPLNPIEALLASFNTNPYFIGLMMLILNLGGRHLAGGLTPEQDKFFQNPWIRRALLFVVIFVATRNVLTAFWLSLAIIVVIGYLTNETSALYLFGKRKEPFQAPALPPMTGLTGEEQGILRQLSEKAQKIEAEKKGKEVPNEEPSFVEAYPLVMSALTR